MRGNQLSHQGQRKALGKFRPVKMYRRRSGFIYVDRHTGVPSQRPTRAQRQAAARGK